jgi:hypothetical protein
MPVGLTRPRPASLRQRHDLVCQPAPIRIVASPVALARAVQLHRPARGALRDAPRRHLRYQFPLLAHAKPLFSSTSRKASFVSICSATKRLMDVSIGLPYPADDVRKVAIETHGR